MRMTFKWLFVTVSIVDAFQQASIIPRKTNPNINNNNKNNNDNGKLSLIRMSEMMYNGQRNEGGDNVNHLKLVPSSSRRGFVLSTTQTTIAAVLMIGTCASSQSASAGIDVSGLPSSGQGGESNADLKQQLRAYDGSGMTRVREVKDMQSTMNRSNTAGITFNPTTSTSNHVGVATWALRATEPTLTSTKFGTKTLYQGQVVSPEGPRGRNLQVAFEFPSDWLALDRASGCIQYVDQRNGDKVYILRVTLPPPTTEDQGNESTSSSLATIPKSWIAKAVFDPSGSLVRTGQPVEDYKATRSIMLQECSNSNNNTMCATHRRFQLKYATVTGNGLRVERRGLVDAYQIPGTEDVYMCMTSSNANKFENADSLERQTVEAIVDSFRIER